MRVYPRLGGDKIRGLKCCRFLHFARLTDIGTLDLIDDDKVCLTNLKRQIIATRSTVGKYKAEVMRDRILDINPDCKVEVHKCFYLPETRDEFEFSS